MPEYTKMGTFLRTLGASLNPEVAQQFNQESRLAQQQQQFDVTRQDTMGAKRKEMIFQFLQNSMKNPNLTEEQRMELGSKIEELTGSSVPVAKWPSASEKRGGYTSLVDYVMDGQIYKVPFDHRAGKYLWDQKMLTDGQGGVTNPPLSTKDPSVQRDIEAGKASGKITGKEVTTEQLNLPKVKSSATYLKSVIDKAIASPGFEAVVGAPNPLGKLGQYVPGTDYADFKAVQEQIEGKTFMSAYETLKGGGQITEIEGTKATSAMQRLKISTSEKAYIEAADEFKREIDLLAALAEFKSSGGITRGLNEEEMEAFRWAMENRNNPKADAVLRKLGGK